MIWHGAGPKIYRGWFNEIAGRNIDLTVLVPSVWSIGYINPVITKTDEGLKYKILVRKIKNAGNACLFYYPDIYNIIKTVKPDLIHLYEEPFGLAAFLTILVRNIYFKKTPVILYTLDNIGTGYGFYLKLFRKYVLGSINYACGCYDEMKEVLSKSGYTGSYENIPLGCDQKYYTPQKNTRLKTPIVVGYAGRLIDAKGLDTLTLAFSLLISKGYDMKLLLVGDGPYKEIINKIAKEKGILQNIEIISDTKHENIITQYHKMDMLVLPSQTTSWWKEQFGRVIAEAMFCKIPVIGSNSGSIPSVIAGKGLIFKEGNEMDLAGCIEKYIVDKQFREKNISDAYIYAQNNYTWSSVTDKWVKLYDKVLTKAQ